MSRIVFDERKLIRSFYPHERATVSVLSSPVGVVTSDVVTTRGDATIRHAKITGGVTRVKLNVTMPFGDTASPLFTALTPEVLTVSADGTVNFLKTGFGLIAVETTRGRVLARVENFPHTKTELIELIQWVPGSLAHHIDESIAAMVAGKVPGPATQDLLSSTSGGYQTPHHVRNEGLFTGDLDLSAISVYMQHTDSSRYPVVLMSADHVIAGHVGCRPGTKIVFKAPNGTYHVRTVIKQVGLDSQSGFSQDYVGVLNEPITAIDPMQMMPTDSLKYLPSLGTDLAAMPVLNKGSARGDKIRILENGVGIAYEPTNTGNDYFLYVRQARARAYTGWTSPVIGGDSNGPTFVPVNGRPVLLMCMTWSLGAPAYGNALRRALIQKAMDQLSDEYGRPRHSPVLVDLSGFPTYA